MAPATTDLPRPFRPHVTAQAMSALHRVLDRRNPLWYAVASTLMRTPPLYHVFTFAERVVKEVNARMRFLLDVGLDYLTLNRSAGTLAGGEAQRIRLATQIGSALTGAPQEPTLQHPPAVTPEPVTVLHDKDTAPCRLSPFGRPVR